MSAVKLVKTGSEKMTLWGSTGSVERVANTYAVIRVADDTPIGYVQQDWGLDYPGSRAKVTSIWLARDNDDQKVGFGWYDYRADAVQAVARNAGLAK